MTHVLYHISLAKKPRTVPRSQQHRWDLQPRRGQTATCLDCGCQKIHQLNCLTFYRATPGSTLQQQRPSCHKPEPPDPCKLQPIS